MFMQVNVIHGCNEKCTYCVVPNTRGIEQSRAPEAIRVRSCTCNVFGTASNRKARLKRTHVIFKTWLLIRRQRLITNIAVTAPHQSGASTA